MKAAKTKHNSKTVTKTFRLPSALVDTMSSDAEKNNKTLTGMIVDVLTHYARFDRFAEKFGFVTMSRGLLKELVDSLPEERIREIAESQSEVIAEMVEFWHENRDMESLLDIVDIYSRYMRRFEYTAARDGHETVVTLRSDLGRKFSVFMGAFWAKGINRVLGVDPKVEVTKNQVTLRIPA